MMEKLVRLGTLWYAMELIWRTKKRIKMASNIEGQLNELHRNIYYNLPQSFTTAEGIAIAESYGMKEHAFKQMLKRNLGTLFKKEKHGMYSK